MSDDFLIRAEHVSKKFCRNLQGSLRYGFQDVVQELRGGSARRDQLRLDEFWSLKDVSFELRRGEALGLIGRNGAGKSTLLQLLNGRLKLDEGRITVRGTAGLVTELGAGFNAIQTGKENVYNSAAVLGMSTERIDAVYGDIVEFAELEEAMDTPVQNYSSGMRARLGYAVVAHLRPDILMVDEVLAVGDIAFRRKCIQHMIRYLRSGGSLVLVAHDMYALQAICTRCILLESGRTLLDASAVEGLSRYYDLLRARRVKGHAESGADVASVDSKASGGLDPTAPSNFLEVLAPAPRPGVEPSDSNPVVIDALCIRGQDGEGVRTGSSAIVEMHYRTLRGFDGIHWGFTICTGDQLIQIASGLSVGRDGGGFPLVEGQGVLSCTIPRVPFVAGTYVLKGGIQEGADLIPLAELGWKTPPTIFAVRSSVNVANNIRAILENLIVLDVVWEDP